MHSVHCESFDLNALRTRAEREVINAVVIVVLGLPIWEWSDSGVRDKSLRLYLFGLVHLFRRIDAAEFVRKGHAQGRAFGDLLNHGRRHLQPVTSTRIVLRELGLFVGGIIPIGAIDLCPPLKYLSLFVPIHSPLDPR